MAIWLTLHEAEVLTGRDEAEIYSAMRRGRVRGVRLGEWLIDAASVRTWATSTASPALWS